MKKLACALLVIGLALCALPAWADLTMQMKTDDAMHFMRVTDHKIAMEAGDKNMIFRGDKQVLWVVDPAEKSYMEITAEQAKAMGQKVNDAMARMREQMKDLPPERKAIMEKMMSGKMSHAASKRTIKPLNQSKTINGFACKGYSAVGDGIEMEVWSTDPKALKLEGKDLGALKELADFMSSSFPGMDQLKDIAKDFEHPREDQVPGLPILTIGKDKDGKETWRAEVVKIEKGSIADSYFDLPEGLTKSDPSMGK